MSNIKNRPLGKVTEEELKTIQEQQQKVNNILVEIGYQESKKHSLLHHLGDANAIIDATKKDLQEKYGHVDIDLSTGNWKRNKDVNNKKD